MTFIPYVEGSHSSRRTAAAALALLDKNPSQKVVFEERVRVDENTQRNVSAKVFNFARVHGLKASTRVVNGVVYGFLEKNEQPEAPEENCTKVTVNVFTEPEKTAKKWRGGTPEKRRRNEAYSNFIARLLAAEGKQITLTTRSLHDGIPEETLRYRLRITQTNLAGRIRRELPGYKFTSRIVPAANTISFYAKLVKVD